MPLRIPAELRVALRDELAGRAKHGVATADGAADGTTVISLWDPTAGEGIGEANDFWNDSWLLILTGAMAEQRRRVTNWALATGTLTVAPAFLNPNVSLLTANVAATDTMIPVVDASVFSLGAAYIWDDAPNAEAVTITDIDLDLNQLTIDAPGLVADYTLGDNAAISMARVIVDGTQFRLETVAKTTGELVIGEVEEPEWLVTDKDTHFTEAIAQNAKEDENLAGLAANKVVITDVMIEADENLQFYLLFWSTDGIDDTDLDDDSFLGFVDLDIPNNGFRIAGAGQYYLNVTDVNLHYEDEDASTELHVSLLCRTAAGKTAAAAGDVKVKIGYKVRE